MALAALVPAWAAERARRPRIQDPPGLRSIERSMMVAWSMIRPRSPEVGMLACAEILGLDRRWVVEG
jgi:hypothetical protein